MAKKKPQSSFSTLGDMLLRRHIQDFVGQMQSTSMSPNDREVTLGYFTNALRFAGTITIPLQEEDGSRSNYFIISGEENSYMLVYAKTDSEEMSQLIDSTIMKNERYDKNHFIPLHIAKQWDIVKKSRQ